MAPLARFVFLLTICLLVTFIQQPNTTIITFALANACNPREFVYGANHLVDELLTCSLSKSFDLDLTPHGDHAKSTSKTLIEQGISNRTSILHARLSGIWSAKRPSFVETGWRCELGGKTTSSSIIELSSLSLEVVEKMEAPMSRNQHKLSAHRPCKTFDLPTWMCRQTKPIYRTISTWANRVYYNLTLVQNSPTSTPTIAKLSTMFTCPETFRQRITYSPSSTYLLTRHSALLGARPAKPTTTAKRDVKSVNEIPSFGHTSSFTTSHSSNMPASPLYHNSVKVIIDETTQVLRSAIEECIGSLEANLSLVGDYRSFKGQKYTADMVGPTEAEGAGFQDDVHTGITNECSNKLWIKSRIELANQVNSLEEEQGLAKLKSNPTMKRNQIAGGRPTEPGELLNPYGFYHDPSADLMID